MMVYALLSLVVVCGCVASASASFAEPPGLYGPDDLVAILNSSAFGQQVLSSPTPWLVQFYNSYCGHCRKLAPQFKLFARDVSWWKRIIKIGVIDCAQEFNVPACREYEIMHYPTLRYFQENSPTGELGLNVPVPSTSTKDELKQQLANMMRNDQRQGRIPTAPPLASKAYDTLQDAINDAPPDSQYVFGVFVEGNSTLGAELALFTDSYKSVSILSILLTSKLALSLDVDQSDGIFVLRPSQSMLSQGHIQSSEGFKIINSYLDVAGYTFPATQAKFMIERKSSAAQESENSDKLYVEDLETAIRSALHTEVIRKPYIQGESLQALINLINVIIESYPLDNNALKAMLSDLVQQLRRQTNWMGGEIQSVLKTVENNHPQAFKHATGYKRCLGSAPQYRGYTCSLWSLFHTLTVNAPPQAGPRILQAMRAYIRHFFGCEECQQHFDAMARSSHMDEANDNEKATLWLWVAHNKVNLRLAGDATEDPGHPKRQYPPPSLCPDCRLVHGAWNLTAVMQFLRTTYGPGGIAPAPVVARSGAPEPPSPLAALDLGALGLVYLISCLILILVTKVFFMRHKHLKRQSRDRSHFV